MPQKTKGASVALQGIAADLAELRAYFAEMRANAVFNPDLVKDLIDAGYARLNGIEHHIANLEPLLERQAPRYEERLKAVEEQLAALAEGRPLAPRIRSVK